MELDAPKLYDDFDRDEAVRRLPEVEDIKDETLREATIGVIRDMPGYFWTAPASSRHHPREHRMRHGLWLHTKRVCTAFERIAPSFVKQGKIGWEDVDYGRAACLLHDMYKYGMPPTSVDGTVDDHDVIAANWLDGHALIAEPVKGAVEAHNGPWYQGKVPETELEQLVHTADMHASDENVRIAVKDMHPVLEEQFPRVSER